MNYEQLAVQLCMIDSCIMFISNTTCSGIDSDEEVYQISSLMNKE